jgi:hypothetical protein
MNAMGKWTGQPGDPVRVATDTSRAGDPAPVVSVEMFTPAETAAWQVAKDRKLSMSCADLRAMLDAAARTGRHHVLAEIEAILDGFDWDRDDTQYALEAVSRALLPPEQDEEPPGPEYDPGEECDDERGMSEHRYAIVPSDDVPF